MKPPTIRVSLGFGNLPDNTLITFARNVHAQLYSNPEPFPDLPVTAPVLLEKIEVFATAKAAQASGGKAATADKNNKRDDLLVSLKKLALYVQDAADNDLALLLSTGFEAVSTNRATYPLSKPFIIRIVARMTGEMLLTLSTQSISRGCEIRVAEVDAEGTQGPFRPLQFSTTSRNIVIGDLTPGSLYIYQGRNVGGSTLYSDWSDLITQRAV
jgi:hypothetical protein